MNETTPEGYKLCKGCNEIKPLSEFHKKSKSKDGHSSKCKECVAEQAKKYRDEHPEENKARCKQYYQTHKLQRAIYDAQHKEERKEYNKKYREEHKEYFKAKHDEYHAEHKEEELEKARQYYLGHKEECIEKHKIYYQENSEKLKAYTSNYAQQIAKYKSFADKLQPYEEVQLDPDNPELLQVKCKNSKCQKWFNPTNKEVQLRLGAINYSYVSGEKNFYCSEECKKSCSIYRAHDKPKDMNIKSVNDREVQPELRALVLARDNYTCQHEGCGKSLAEFPDLVLHCHHKFPLNEDPVCSADIDNCITLCADCHKWVHKNIPGCSYIELRCTKDHSLNNQE